MDDWKIYRGTETPHDGIQRLPPPPPWRDFRTLEQTRGAPSRPARVRSR